MNKKIILVILVLILLLTGCNNKKITTDEDIVKYIEKYFDDKVSIISILDDTKDNKKKVYTLKSKKGFEFNVENILDKKGITKYYKTDYIENLLKKNNTTKAKLYNKYSRLKVTNTFANRGVKLYTTLKIYNFDNIENLNNFLYEYYDFLKQIGLKYEKNNKMLEVKVLLNNEEYLTISSKQVQKNTKDIHLLLLKNKYIEDVDNNKIELTKKVKNRIFKANKHTHINTLIINKEEIKEHMDFTYNPSDKNYIFNFNKNSITTILKQLKIDYSNKNNVIKYNIGTNNYEIKMDKKIVFKLNNKDLKISKTTYPYYLEKKEGYYIKIDDLFNILEKKYEIKDNTIKLK